MPSGRRPGNGLRGGEPPTDLERQHDGHQLVGSHRDGHTRRRRRGSDRARGARRWRSPARQGSTIASLDRRPALVPAYELAADIAAGVGPGQLGRPTACPEYDVAALVDHLVGAGHRAVALGRGETPTGDEFPHVRLGAATDQLDRLDSDLAATALDGARAMLEPEHRNLVGDGVSRGRARTGRSSPWRCCARPTSRSA